MFAILVVCAYLCGFSFVLGLFPLSFEERPTLEAFGFGLQAETQRKKKRQRGLRPVFRRASMIARPLCKGVLRQRVAKDLAVAHVDLSPEEFIFCKILGVLGVLAITFPSVEPDFIPFWFLMSFAFGYMLPEIWIKGKIRKVKAVMIKELPDAIDLLGLCVNAGLDFILSLKWVVEKSPRSYMIDELNTVLQEINVGKTRRDALKDMAARYDLPDLSTFSRTLIQADKMGTSVTEALNILSEDMRISRYRRGEQIALKAPLKMLVPLLFFIFPVVAILVAGPILIDFMENNPFAGVTGR